MLCVNCFIGIGNPFPLLFMTIDKHHQPVVFVWKQISNEYVLGQSHVKTTCEMFCFVLSVVIIGIGSPLPYTFYDNR